MCVRVEHRFSAMGVVSSKTSQATATAPAGGSLGAAPEVLSSYEPTADDLRLAVQHMNQFSSRLMHRYPTADAVCV